DSGAPTDSNNAKTVIGNPIDIAISVLVDYLGLDTSTDMDLDAFHDYRDKLFEGAIFKFKITSPPEAKAFLETQIFKPLGGYLRTNNEGKLTPFFFLRLPGAATVAMTLDRSNTEGIPDIQ